jgi:hypothetical protein
MRIALTTLAALVLTGCCNSQRFVPVGGGADFRTALDTKTGQLCRTMSQHSDGDQVPRCYDLYKGAK